MRTLTSITAPAARAELLHLLSTAVGQLSDQIETTKALAAFNAPTNEPLEHGRFIQIAHILADFRERLTRAL
jgi:hypothetical protein